MALIQIKYIICQQGDFQEPSLGSTKCTNCTDESYDDPANHSARRLQVGLKMPWTALTARPILSIYCLILLIMEMAL